MGKKREKKYGASITEIYIYINEYLKYDNVERHAQVYDIQKYQHVYK